MPQSEILGTSFHYPVPNREVKTQLLQTPSWPHVTLPNIRWFAFEVVRLTWERFFLGAVLDASSAFVYILISSMGKSLDHRGWITKPTKSYVIQHGEGPLGA
jgi:hypothetical protein